MNIRHFFCCLFSLFFLATLLCSPLWAEERTVQMTIPGCDS